jgi:hypothetical protein
MAEQSHSENRTRRDWRNPQSAVKYSLKGKTTRVTGRRAGPVFSAGVRAGARRIRKAWSQQFERLFAQLLVLSTIFKIENEGGFVKARIILVATAVLFTANGSALPLRGPIGNPARSGAAAAEMERLKFYLGEWDYTETYPKSPAIPAGGVNTGVYTSRLGPSGNSLVNTFHSKGPVGEFEGLQIMTWDASEKAYKMYVFGDFPGAIVEKGTFEGETLVFRASVSMGKAAMELRNVTRLVDGRIESEQYATVPGSAEKLFVKVVASKR